VPARPAEFVGAGAYGQIVNRTDRLYALVEELRACAPRRRSARELAALYEVSARTIERDIGALQQAGVPIYADAGRSGGYTVDKSLTLPPLNFSPAEAVAVAVARPRSGRPPAEHDRAPASKTNWRLGAGVPWARRGGRDGAGSSS
jgi:predicted DNA-binding transcriptional regulator YafY